MAGVIEPVHVLHAAVYTIVALILLTGGGNWACRAVFSLTGLKDSTADATSAAHPAGWIIGWLERIILAIGIISHSWEVLAAVIALKTVARFKELDDRRFGEYFLVGSLFSVLWAVLITGAWMTYDHHLGIGLSASIAEGIAAPVKSGAT